MFLAGRLSVASQAANHIALSMAHFAFMFHIGLGVTAVVRTGNQVGKPNIKELVSRLLQSILVIVVCMTCFMGVAIFCAKDQIPFIYVDDYNVCVIASTLLVFAAIFQFLDGFHVFIIGALRGLQDVNIPTLILLVSYWGIGLFSTYYWSQEHLYAEKGIWIGLISSISFAVVLLYLRLKYLVARLD